MNTLSIRSLTLALVWTALLGAPALAQDDGQLTPLEEEAKKREAQKQNLPAPEVIFDRYIEAVGGAEALKGLRNRVHDGLLNDSASGSQKWLTMTYVAPNKLRIEIEEPGGTTYKMVFDGEVGWLDAGEGNQRLLVGATLVDLSNDADFYGEANYRARYREMQTEAKRDFHGRDAYYVKFRTRIGNKPGYAIFDAESGILLGTLTYQARGEEIEQIESFIVGYDEHAGVKLPTEIVQTDESGNKTTFVFRRTRVNVPDPGSFQRPPAIVQQVARVEQMTEEQKNDAGG